MIKKIAAGIFCIVMLLLTGIWFWQTKTIQTAPIANFRTLQGNTIELSALRGQPVLVTFWATDCASCIEEIPDLISLHQQFNSSGLNIIAVSMYYDPPNHVLNLTKSRQIPYQVALDPSGSVAQAFGNVNLTPTSFLIDRTGKIVLHKVGVFDLADMQKRIAQL